MSQKLRTLGGLDVLDLELPKATFPLPLLPYVPCSLPRRKKITIEYQGPLEIEKGACMIRLHEGTILIKHYASVD